LFEVEGVIGADR